MKAKLTSNAKRQISLNLDAINAYVAKYHSGTVFDFELVRRVPKQIASPEQRGYYFAEVLPALLRGCGYDPDDAEIVHKHLKIIFFHVQPDSRGIYLDKNVPSVFSLESDIGQEQRGKFIDWVCRKAAEQGEYVASPKEG